MLRLLVYIFTVVPVWKFESKNQHQTLFICDVDPKKIV